MLVLSKGRVDEKLKIVDENTVVDENTEAPCEQSIINSLIYFNYENFFSFLIHEWGPIQTAYLHILWRQTVTDSWATYRKN